jgi:hypothetical protein
MGAVLLPQILSLDYAHGTTYHDTTMRKIIPTKSQLTILSDMAAKGAKRVDIAKAMGITSRTLARLIIGDEFPEVKQRYLEAKQVYANDLAEDVIRQASAPLHDDPKLANAEIQRRRLIVDTSKWVASKLLPKVYGDNLKINHEHSGEVKLSPLAQLRQLERRGPVVDVSTVDKLPGAPEAPEAPAPDTPAPDTPAPEAPVTPAISEDDCF